jgi:hypothetical protein
VEGGVANSTIYNIIVVDRALPCYGLVVQARTREIDCIQRVVARLVATSPAGVNLLLIGGFRYRLLDNSQRFAVDIEYHWGGDVAAKAGEMLALCRRVILKRVRQELGYEGSAYAREGPDADSPNARFVGLHFRKEGQAIEVPLEITQIVCLDPPTVRTAGGAVHATPSDADVTEGKVLAVLNRLCLQHRDLADLFLHNDKLRPDSPARLKQKLAHLQLPQETVERRLTDLKEHQGYHATGIQKVIDEQFEPAAAQQINAAGGGKAVFESALSVLLGSLTP